MANYVQYLQPELRVNYCRLITVSVDHRYDADDMREALGAEWPFLCDTDRKLLNELEMVDKTDYLHGDIYIPFPQDRTLSLEGKFLILQNGLILRKGVRGMG